MAANGYIASAGAGGEPPGHRRHPSGIGLEPPDTSADHTAPDKLLHPGEDRHGRCAKHLGEALGVVYARWRRAHQLPDKHHHRMRRNDVEARHEVGHREIAQVHQREVAVPLAYLTPYRFFDVAVSIVGAVDHVDGAGLRKQCLRERNRVADPQATLESDDVVPGIQLSRCRHRRDNRRVSEQPAVPPRETQRTESPGDDDVNLPAGVLVGEITREDARLIRTREALAFDRLLVELDR